MLMCMCIFTWTVRHVCIARAQVLMRLLDYTPQEAKAMAHARERRAARSSLWGRITGPA